MKDNQKNFLHDIIAEILELPKNKIIWAYQNNMPRQQPPYVILRLWGAKAEAQEEIRSTEDSAVKNVYVSQNVILEVQYFAGTKCNIDPSHELQILLRELETPPVVERFFAARLAVYDSENIQDLTDLTDGQTYEYRAMVELRVRYGSEIKTNLGAIEEVSGTIEYLSEGE